MPDPTPSRPTSVTDLIDEYCDPTTAGDDLRWASRVARARTGPLWDCLHDLFEATLRRIGADEPTPQDYRIMPLNQLERLAEAVSAEGTPEQVAGHSHRRPVARDEHPLAPEIRVLRKRLANLDPETQSEEYKLVFADLLDMEERIRLDVHTELARAWPIFLDTLANTFFYNGAPGRGQEFYDRGLNGYLASLPNPHQAEVERIAARRAAAAARRELRIVNAPVAAREALLAAADVVGRMQRISETPWGDTVASEREEFAAHPLGHDLARYGEVVRPAIEQWLRDLAAATPDTECTS